MGLDGGGTMKNSAIKGLTLKPNEDTIQPSLAALLFNSNILANWGNMFWTFIIALCRFVFFILSGAFKADLRRYLIAFSRHIFNWVWNSSYC